MKESVQAGLSPEKSPTGLSNWEIISISKLKDLTDSAVLGAARNAAVNESNAKIMVCATPTAGSAGCVHLLFLQLLSKNWAS